MWVGSQVRAGGLSVLVSLEVQVQVSEEPFSHVRRGQGWSAASQALWSLPLGSGHPRPSGPSHTEEVPPLRGGGEVAAVGQGSLLGWAFMVGDLCAQEGAKPQAS